MTLVTWNDSLSVGVDVIDADHKVLIDQINMLGEAVVNGKDDVMTASVLNVLIDYTVYHFAREQQMMEQTAYGAADDHLREHRLLVKKCRDIQLGYRQGTALGKDVLNFLKVWLTQHILKSDKALGQWLRDRGAARMVPPARKQGPVDFEQLSVLVVDDQFNFRSLLRNILNSCGISRVREARDGQEAFDLLSGEPAEVVLVDDGMTPVDGLEFTRMVRASKGNPDPRTVIILLPSEEITKEYLRKATRAGVHDLVVKPLATNAVRSRIERHMAHPLPFQEINGQLVPVRQPPAQSTRATAG
jgi:hemerythrin-like metal-binding protein